MIALAKLRILHLWIPKPITLLEVLPGTKQSQEENVLNLYVNLAERERVLVLGLHEEFVVCLGSKTIMFSNLRQSFGLAAVARHRDIFKWMLCHG